MIILCKAYFSSEQDEKVRELIGNSGAGITPKEDLFRFNTDHVEGYNPSEEEGRTSMRFVSGTAMSINKSISEVDDIFKRLKSLELESIHSSIKE